MKSLLSYYLIKLFRLVLDFSTNIFFGFIHGKPKELPPITNHLLLQPASQLAQKIRTNQIKSVDVVSAYIARIREVQPIINAIVDERFETALKEAQAVDDFIFSGDKPEAQIEIDTPLLGVPFTCKEAIAVKGLSFTSGLVSRRGVKAESDSAAVVSLRAAGAIPIASTNVCELCMWFDCTNCLYGITRNPYDTRRIPGGSTGGEGAIIGAAGSVFGVGNDIGGSVRIPAFMNGIFGHKFSTGIVSNEGQYPVAESTLQDYLVTGPLCRYATDLLPVAKILSRQDSRLKLDSQVNFRNLKIYYMEDDGDNPLLTPVAPEIKESLKRVLTYFEETYGIHPQKLHLEGLKQSFQIWSCKMGTADVPPFVELMAGLEGRINLKREFLKWCFRLSEHTAPALFLAFLQLFAPEKDSKEQMENFELCHTLESQFQDILKENCIFLYPTHPEPAPYQHETLPKICNIGYTGIFNILGLPVTQSPLSLCRGLPIGIQVVGGMHKDHLTIAVAVELEKVFGGWVSPNPIL